MKGKIFCILFALLFIANSILLANPPGEIKVGALLSLTGSVSSIGQKSSATLEMAAEDINKYLASVGMETRVKLIIEDTEADPNTAVEKLKALIQQDVKLVIGPMTSGEVEATKAVADKSGVILISQSSTAPDLAQPNDNVFRLVPDDNHQAEVIARLMWNDGIKFIIPIWRGDVWGDNLSKATRKWFSDLGGEMAEDVKYNSETKDFSKYLKTMNSLVEKAIDKYSESAVGVYLISLNEAVSILSQADKFDFLPKVKWYGSDGTALNGLIVQDAQAASFAEKTRFVNPFYCGATTEKGLDITGRMKSKSGKSPDDYSFIAYDALWIAAMTSIFASNGDGADPAVLKNVLQHTANTYYGVTGWTVINDAGDRDFGDYNFWIVEKSDGGFKWERIAKFIADPALEGIIIYLR